MAAYEVQVAEAIDVPPSVAANEPTPEIRTLVCKVEAVDEDAAGARGAWGHIWEAKYGVGRLPLQAVVKVTPLAGA